MKKNVASQKVGAQMLTASDGSVFTGTVTVYITGDAGTQAIGSVGSGVCTHEGNGYHTYAPSQAETNYDLIAFTFTGTLAAATTVQIYTDFPQTGDSYPIVSSGSYGNSALKTLIDTIDDFLDTEIAALTTNLAIANTNINTIDDFLDTEIATIKVKTDNLPAQPASTGDITTALNTYDSPTKAELDTAVGTLSTSASIVAVQAVVDAVKVVTDALTAASATKLAASAGQILLGTVDSTGFTPTTTAFESDDITEATADHYNGRVIIFTSGALAGQATSITTYTNSGGRGHFVVVALTEAPVNNGTFVIV